MPPTHKISLHLFGSMEIVVDDYLVAPFATRRARQLFAYLVLNRRRFHAREHLADLFWPDRSAIQSQSSLRTELWRIRSAFARFKNLARQMLVEDSHAVCFSPTTDCWIDVDEFDAYFLERDTHATCVKSLSKAVSLYRGDLLEGIDEEWCTYHRELYGTRYLSALERLLSIAMRDRQWSNAVDYAMRFLVHDPLAEHIHRNLMACYKLMGNRAAAIRQFEVCRQRLSEALGVSPLPETITVFEECRKECLRGFRHTRPLKQSNAHGRDVVAAALNSLTMTRDNLLNATRSLETLISEIDRGR